MGFLSNELGWCSDWSFDSASLVDYRASALAKVAGAAAAGALAVGVDSAPAGAAACFC